VSIQLDYTDRIKAVYLFVSEPEMSIYTSDGNLFMDRRKFWHVVNRQTDELTKILWGKIRKHVPQNIIHYFLKSNGGYIRWQGFYFRMGLYDEIGYPYDEVVMYATAGKRLLCDVPVYPDVVGHA